MKRDFWGIDGEIWGWNRYIISNAQKRVLKNTPCKIGQMFKRKGGGGSKAFWTMLKKTALFLMNGFPYCDHQSFNKCDYQVRCNMRTSPKVPSKVEVRSTPDICRFWYANALFRPVRNAPRNAWFRTKSSKWAKIVPKFAFFELKSMLAWKVRYCW